MSKQEKKELTAAHYANYNIVNRRNDIITSLKEQQYNLLFMYRYIETYTPAPEYENKIKSLLKQSHELWLH